MFDMREQLGSSPSKKLFDKSKKTIVSDSQMDSGTRPIIRLEARHRVPIFGARNPNGSCPDKKFVETSNSVRLLSTRGICPLRWFELIYRLSKLVMFQTSGGIAPLMLLIERSRKRKPVKCCNLFGSIPLMLLSAELKKKNFLEHCGKFSISSVMFPDDRLPSSHRVSSWHKFSCLLPLWLYFHCC